MEAKDLRIGNLVTDEFYDSFKTIIEVESLNDKGINLEIEDDGNYPECAERWIEPYYRLDQLLGIPLTEEWLLKFGFKYNEEDEAFQDKIIHIENRDGDRYLPPHIKERLEGCFGVWFNSSASMLIQDVKYVHQLQNLYFALTNKELTLADSTPQR
mgnify:CR=1 FL=1